MIKWTIFIAASLVLHMIVFIIPFPVSFHEDPDRARIVVDVELVHPVKEATQSPDIVAKVPSISRRKIQELHHEDKPSEQMPTEVAQPLSAPSAEGSENMQNLPERSSHFQPRLVTAADIVKRFHPVYPLASRRRGEEGEVRLLVTLGLNGSIKTVTVSTSSGYVPLDESAVNAVRKWLFSPGSPEKMIVPVIFRLDP